MKANDGWLLAVAETQRQNWEALYCLYELCLDEGRALDPATRLKCEAWIAGEGRRLAQIVLDTGEFDHDG